MSAPTSEIPLEDQIACVKRELRLRENVYPNLCRQGKMAQHFADKEISAMKAVLQTLLSLHDKTGSQSSLGI